MSDQINKLDLLAELSTEEQELLSGGQMGGFPGGGGGFPGGGGGFPGGGGGFPGGGGGFPIRFPTYICRPYYG